MDAGPLTPAGQLARDALLRPLDVLLGCIYLLLGRASPANLRGGPATGMILATLWFTSSALWDERVCRSLGEPFRISGAALELMLWSISLWWILRQVGKGERFWQTWLATAGVSTLGWLVSLPLMAAGIPTGLAALITLAVFLRGFGRTLHCVSDGAMQSPYTTAGWWLFAIAIGSSIVTGIIPV